MNQSLDFLGLTPAEIHELVQRLTLPADVAGDELSLAPSPAEQQARRQALEAAATLIAANNRRLTEQLHALGLLGDATRPVQPGATSGERLAHD